MKVLLIVSLILLSVNSGLTTQISKYKRNKSKSLGIIDELNFDQFSPKEQDLIKLANFAAGFFSNFIKGMEGVQQLFMGLFKKDGECSVENLTSIFNSIKLDKEVAVWKSEKDCLKALEEQKKFAENLVEKRKNMIVSIERLYQKTTSEKEIKELRTLEFDMLEKLDGEYKDLISKENYNCKVEFKNVSFKDRLYMKLKQYILFYDNGLSPCFKKIFQTATKGLAKKLGIAFAVIGLKVAAKIFPVFTIVQFGALLISLGKKIYDLHKVLKSKNIPKIAFAYGQLTGKVVDILTAGFLSKRKL